MEKILDAIAEAWDEQLSVCEICPTRCVSEKDRYCTMFDRNENEELKKYDGQEYSAASMLTFFLFAKLARRNID